jgi:transposase
LTWNDIFLMKKNAGCYFMRRLVLIEVETLLSLPEGLRVEQIELQGDILEMAVVSVRPSSCCPLCAQASSQVHSRYRRTLRDVPCAGREVVLHLSVRKFFCRNPDCARKIFTERLPPFVEPWAQATSRLFEAVQAIGLATGGELGTRLADRIGFHTSPSAILDRIMALAPCSFPPVSCLGIDDWSFRRGRKFGTILVDLTTHTIIDLLPDRCAETSASWMRKHPEIEMVSRDRGEEYAAAARTGAPQAIECADRFHLAKNLTEVVEEILARCRAEIRQASKSRDAVERAQERENTERPSASPDEDPVPEPLAGSAHLARHAERSDRYQQLLELKSEGLTNKEIAHRLGMAERTVRHWFKRGIPYGKPELRRKRSHAFDPYIPYVTERWQQGERNGLRLLQELQAQGFKGGSSTVYRFLRSLRGYSASPQGKAERAQAVPEEPLQDFSAKDAVWLFLRRPADLDETEKHHLALICQASPTANLLYELVQEFMNMLRHRKGERLDDWIRAVRDSHIKELLSFVRGIERDKAAVLAGLTLPQSNGMTEGFVNKLKLIKRMGFGRAGFPLLRQRVLHAL